MTQPSPQQLVEILTDYFNLGELRSLAFTLGIDYEDLEGGNKPGKALALVQYAQRHSRYADLVNAVRQARPHLNLSAPTPQANQPTGPQTNQAANQPAFVIQGDYIAGDKTGGDKVEGDKVSGDKVGGDKITVGDISGSTGVAIGRGASANVTINAPQNREEFAQQLAELKTLLEKAIAAQEIPAEDGETALEDLQDVAEEAAKAQPRTKRMSHRLEDVSEVVSAAGKAGAAVLKVTPILAGLIKAIGVIF